MFLRLCQVSALLSTVFLAALPANSSTITSSNGNDILATSSASSFSGLGWLGLVTGEADDNGFFAPATSFVTGTATFGVSGANGIVEQPGASLAGATSTAMIVTPPGGDTALTAIALQLTGNITIQLTLSDGSTVTESSTGTGSWVSFTSPLQITAIQFNSAGGTFSVQDFSTGTAIVADLPPQGGSSTPEVASIWLTGGGLLVLSRFLRRRCRGA